MKKFNVRQVEAFRAVVTLGSMTKAAELLAVSQPAISRLILDFQEAVGFQLFRRQRNGTEPTEDAKQLFQQVEKLFIGLEELNQQVSDIKNLNSGRLSIAALGLYANGLLPEIISVFTAAHPAIAISLISQQHDTVIDWVASRRADIGFTTLPAAHTSINVRSLALKPAVCVVPYNHRLAHREFIEAKDLAGLPFVSVPRGTRYRFEVDALFDREGVERITRIEATTHEAICNLVAAGLGVSVVNPFSPYFGRDTRLAFRPFRPELPIELGMIVDEPMLSLAGNRFCQFVESYMSDIGAQATTT